MSSGVPTYVGRKDQLDRLKEIYSQVEKGRGTTLFIFGDVGAGKGAMLRHFVRINDLFLASHKFVERERRPFTAFAGILKELKKCGCTSPNIDKALTLLTDKKSTGDRETLFSTVASALQDCALSKKLVISLHNMHWSDQDDIELFSTLAKNIGDYPVLLAGTYTTGELADIDDQTHPLVEAMGEMMMEGLFTTIEVGALTPKEAEEFIKVNTGSNQPSKHIVATLYSLTKGSPLFMKEMLIDLTNRGILDTTEPNWGDGLDLETWGLPSNMQEAIIEAFNLLNEKEKYMLELMSILGMTFDEKLVSEMTGLDEQEVFDLLLPLIEKRLVDEVEGHYSLHHSFISEPVLASMDIEKKKGLHRNAATALANRKGDEFLVGYHAKEAGELKMASKYLLIASETARKKYALRSAAGAATEALECAKTIGDDNLIATANLCLGKTMHDLGDWNEADAILKTISGENDTSGEAALFIGHIERNRSQWEPALESYKKTLRLMEAKSIGVAEAYRGMGKVAWRQGNNDTSVTYLRMAIEIIRKMDEPALLGMLNIDLGNVHYNTGKPEKAVETYQNAIRSLSKIGDWSQVSRAYNNMGEAHKDSGDIETAMSCYQKALEAAEKAGDRRHRGYALSNVAECHARLGQIDQAKKALEDSDAYFREVGEKYMLACLDMTQGIIAARENMWKASDTYFNKAISSMEGMGIKYDLSVIILAQGELLLENGDNERAKEILNKALEVAKEVDAIVIATRAEKALEQIGGG